MDFLQADEKKGVAKHETEKSMTESLGKTGAGVYDVRPGRISDMDSRSEPLGYINEVRRTDGDHVAHRSDIVQREPAPIKTPVDTLLTPLKKETAEALDSVVIAGGVDASVSDTGVGSLYFGNGRFRLTHRHGPKVSAKKDRSILRFADKRNEMKKMIQKKTIKAGMSKDEILEILNGINGVKQITGRKRPKGGLRELYLLNNVLEATHISRGSLEAYTIKPPNEPELGKSQQELAMEIGKVVAASQRFGEYIKAEMIKEKINMKKVTTDDIKNIVSKVIKDITKPDSKKVPSELASLVNEGNITAAIEAARKEAEHKADEQYRTAFIERIQGYFANQLFLMSGIADRMGISVDKADRWPKEEPKEPPK